MLIPQKTLQAVQAGTVSAVYRWWRSPRVKPGTKLRTALGLIEVRGLSVVEPEGLDLEAAQAAGMASVEALQAEIARYAPRGDDKGSQDGPRLYRVELTHAGADPRVALREQSQLTTAEWQALQQRVSRLGARSRDGAWGEKILRAVAERPRTRAAELARELGMEVRLFKPRVRQLKELGLTESLEVGYRLSPRGQGLLERL